ncbi:MAG TPA: carboxypeptidase-like regulatory domain-containing protein [Terriglobales bacterium]|jgi:hypothetical protein|nr:carboxypeptidase-like regulatory domain-containing protein [Terriglobales bacterium]
MSRGKKITVWVGLACIIAVAAIFVARYVKQRQISLIGAVIRKDTDPNKELPIADVEVIASNGAAMATVKSDATGYFRIRLGARLLREQAVTLQFRHPEYQPMEMKGIMGDKLYLAQMVPLPQDSPRPDHPDMTVGNLVARYSVKETTSANVGSAVRAFQVVNKANVPCKGQDPCSPDGKWKGAIASAALDAGEGNVFRNARASCIAGPCPFTRIESDDFTRGGRNISVTVRNWSDSTTFLLEAEVFHPSESDMVRRSYPVTFGQTLNFTLPATAQGLSIEAEINGDGIVFPVGPELYLSWAECNARVNRDQTKVYRCELKPGYRFK